MMRSTLLFPAFVIIALIAVAGCTGTGTPPGEKTATLSTTAPATTPPVPSVTATPVPTAMDDPYPQALAPGTLFPFGSGKVASEGMVYRSWINDTYDWHNDLDNKYYTAPDRPMPGYKYLFVFVHMTNKGETRVWYPPSRTIAVHYDGNTYTPDTTHFLPDKAEDDDAQPIEIKEIQYFHKLNGDEYVEDFGYSHGTTADYLYPGESNSLDGYIIYVVPTSLTPEKTYVVIPFNGQDTGVWKLA